MSSRPTVKPWENAQKNVSFILHVRGMNVPDVFRKYDILKSQGFDTPPDTDSNRRRYRRIVSGDTQMSLRDIFLLSLALELPVDSMLYEDHKTFRKKYNADENEKKPHGNTKHVGVRYPVSYIQNLKR